MKHNLSSRAGYSLLEVLVAFAIMMMVLTALLPGQVTMLSRATERHDAVLAHEFALSLADETYHLPEDQMRAPQGTYAGRWRWTIDVEDTPTQNHNVVLRNSVITVRDFADKELARVSSLKAIVK